jgi:hypothetical protein
VIQKQYIWCAGLSCLSRSSNHTHQTDQMNQIPAPRRETQGCWAYLSITNPVERDSLSSDGYLILQIPPTCLQQTSDLVSGRSH